MWTIYVVQPYIFLIGDTMYCHKSIVKIIPLYTRILRIFEPVGSVRNLEYEVLKESYEILH
jgi:hypothetical protein